MMEAFQGYMGALRQLPQGVSWAEVNIKSADSVMVTLTDGRVTSAASESPQAAYVRACFDGAGVGMAYTQDMQEDAAGVILRAAGNGEKEAQAAPGADIRFTAQPLDAGCGADALRETGEKLCNMARDRGAAGVTAQIRQDRYQTRVLSSYNVDAGAAFCVYTADLTVTVERGGVRRSADALVTADDLRALPLSQCVSDALRKAEEQFWPRVEIDRGEYPAVLDAAVACNILITAWQLFSADKYLSGASALAGNMGERVACAGVNIADYPAHPGCGYRYDCDDEGVRAGANALVTGGVMTGLLHTRRTAGALGVPPTGNAGRVALLTGAIPTAIIPIPRVLCVTPGERGRDALLQSMGDGLLIPYSFDIFHSINIASGDFSIPCRAALVKNGKVVGVQEDKTLTGNLRELFMDIVEPGDDIRILPFLLRSYCYGAPSLRLRRVRIG